MIKQIFGKLPKKTSSKASHNDTSNDAVLSSVNTLNGGGVNNSSKSNSVSGKALSSASVVSNSGNGNNAPQLSNRPLKLNQGKKPGPVAAQASQVPVYEALPSFRDVSSSEKLSLFIRKLNMCCVLFDFSDASKNLREKDIKRQTLLELVDYISSVTSKFNEVTMQEITKMIAANLFRAFPSNHDNKLLDVYEPEDDEPSMEPSWPHLQIVYEFLLRFVASSETDAKLAKRYIDHSFVLRLLDLFDAEDQREREYLKTILHRIYGKFMVHRPFIRKSINNIFYTFVYETERHNGIAELLEILGSIINGFALPLKEEHKVFLVRALIPLHKPKSVAMYHQQLSYCITQFVEKDNKLADTVIRGILKYWPITNSSKEVMFLGELEEVLEATQTAEFQKCMILLFRQIGRCLNSSHFQVAERALFLWNNDHIRTLITQNRKVILPIIFPALENNTRSHWNQAVHSLTLNVRKIFSDADPTLFDECLAKFQEDEENEKAILEKRESKQLSSVPSLTNLIVAPEQNGKLNVTSLQSPSQHNGEIIKTKEDSFFPELPSPTPKTGIECQNELDDRTRQSVTVNLPCQDIGPKWSNTSSIVVGELQLADISGDWGGYSPTPAEHSVNEWHSSLISLPSIKPTEGLCDRFSTAASTSGELAHSSASHLSSWQTAICEPIEFSTLAEESVSDLLAEVDAMESRRGLASPTSVVNCG